MESNAQRNSRNSKPWRFGSLPDSRFLLLASACYINAVLAVMGDLLFAGGRVVSPAGGGIDARFAFLRAFTFDQLAVGEIPLWNPHIFAGTPHIGGFESGAYYPLSLVHLALPLTAALNVEVALHLFLCALFTYLWLRRIKIHPVGCIYGGLAAMFSGAFYARAMSGDLSVITAFTWLPVALIATFDLSRGRRGVGYVGLLLAVSMPIFAGYPPASGCVVLTVLIYGATRYSVSRHRGMMLRALTIVLVVMPFLTAVQLWVGFGTFTQSVRAGGSTAEALANASIANEDWLTFAAPIVRESITSGHYFIGVTTMALAVFAFVLGTGRFRYVSATCAWVTFLLLVVTALPPFWSLSNVVPPLRYVFRPNLLAIPATLFVIGLASAGTHRLIQAPRAVTPIAAFFAGAAALLAVGASLAETPATARGLLFGALAAGAGAAFVGLARWNVWFRYGLIVVGIAELYGFAITHRPSTELETPPPGVRAKDIRVLEIGWRNPAPGSGVLSASGNAALPSRRFLAFAARTQWTTLASRWNGPFEYVGYHPLHRLARVGLVRTPAGTDAQSIPDPLPRFLIIQDYSVIADRVEALDTMESPTFNPRRTVLLEREPTPIPGSTPQEAKVMLIDESANAFTIETTVTDASILLITDAYARGWHAHALSGSSQWRYNVRPADVAFRAIPLGEGKHRIRVMYSPVSWRIGRWVSVATAAALAGAAAIAVIRRRRRASQSR